MPSFFCFFLYHLVYYLRPSFFSSLRVMSQIQSLTAGSSPPSLLLCRQPCCQYFCNVQVIRTNLGQPVNRCMRRPTQPRASVYTEEALCLGIHRRKKRGSSFRSCTCDDQPSPLMISSFLTFFLVDKLATAVLSSHVSFCKRAEPAKVFSRLYARAVRLFFRTVVAVMLFIGLNTGFPVIFFLRYDAAAVTAMNPGDERKG